MPLEVIIKPPWLMFGMLLSEFWMLADVPLACGAKGTVQIDDCCCCWLTVVVWLIRFNLFWNKRLVDDEFGVLAWNMPFELFVKSMLTKLLLPLVLLLLLFVELKMKFVFCNLFESFFWLINDTVESSWFKLKLSLNEFSLELVFGFTFELSFFSSSKFLCSSFMIFSLSSSSSPFWLLKLSSFSVSKVSWNLWNCSNTEFNTDVFGTFGYKK